MSDKKEFKVLFRVAGFVVASLFCAVFLRFYYLQNFIQDHSSKSERLHQVFEFKYASKIQELGDLLDLRQQNEFNSAKISVQYDLKPYILGFGMTHLDTNDVIKSEIKENLNSKYSYTSLLNNQNNLGKPYFYITRPTSGMPGHVVYYQIDFHQFIKWVLEEILIEPGHHVALYNQQGQPVYSTIDLPALNSINPSDLNPYQQIYTSSSINIHSILVFFDERSASEKFENLSLPFLFFIFLFVLSGSYVINKFNKLDSQIKLQKRFNQDFNEIFRVLIKELDSSVVIANANSVLFCNQKTRIHLQDYESNSFIIPNVNHLESFQIEIDHQALTVFQKAVSFNNDKFTLQLVSNVSSLSLIHI